MANLGVFILVICLNISQIVCQCTLPLADGEWISTSRGTWTVSGSGTQIANFRADLSGTINTATLNCVATGSSSDQFILSTNFELFFQVFIDVYTCIEIVGTDRAPFSYIYYIVTATDTTTGEQFTSDQSAACSNSGFRTPANLNILTQSATVSNATRDFPDIILGNYTVVYENVDSAQETDWQMDSCVDTTLMSFTHASSTSRLGFTTTNAPNLLQCLYFVTEGSSVYAFLYNNGTQDGSTSYSYTCWVFANSGSNVVATAFPETCQDTQTATSVIFGGEKFTFTPFFTCPLNTSSDDEEGLGALIIALIVVSILIFIILIIVLIIYCYIRKSRVKDEEAGLVKGERRPSPDSLREVDIAEEKRKAQEEFKKETGRAFRKTKDDYDFEKGKDTKREKERTIDLIEVSKSKSDKLQDPRPAETDIQDKLKSEGIVKPKEITKTKGQTKQEKQREEKKKEEEKKKQLEEILQKKQEEDKKRQDERKEQEEALKQIIEPTGKQSIPPTTPKPEHDETRLRIEKAREKKRREKEEKRRQEEQRKKDALRKIHKVEYEPKEKVYKTMRETSSSEETDESEREERRRKFNRLANSYDPIDKMVGDASVVGPKRQRKHKQFEDGGDTAGKLISREEDERMAGEKRHRKKKLRKLAKGKVKGHDQPVTSDSDSDTKGRKRRRAGDPRGIEAPHIEKYYHKKDIEDELDKIHYFDEPEEPKQVEEDALATPKPQQVGAEEAVSPSKMEIILQEEENDADNIRVGPNDELPDGYLFDKDGNIIRENDGKIVLTHSQVEQRRKFGHVFSLPRLIRNEDGRPLGGYKDDEFGPTAEWDWGDAREEKDVDTEKGKTEVPSRTVAFSMKDELSSVPATPLNEMDASQRKGRQLGSAERELLKKRLFEQQQRAKTEQPVPVPIYFSGSKGVVKDSAYIDNTQIEKQEPGTVQRSQPVRICSKVNNMIFRSDTFDDGRPARESRLNTNSAFKRGGKLRATWTATSSGIPEETEVPTTQMPSRNIGSLDEFVLVGGSVSKLSTPNATRERSNISDINMKTAPDSPEALGDRKLRKYAGEFLTDKRFFDQYIETEKLPTNATVETRALANEGLDFIHDRAAYWLSKEPEPLRPPPSDLGLRLMRMSTFYTTADSGLDSRMSTMTSRPKSASDANNPNSSRLSQRENTTEQIPFRNQHQQYHRQIAAPSDSQNQANVQVVKVKPENSA